MDKSLLLRLLLADGLETADEWGATLDDAGEGREDAAEEEDAESDGGELLAAIDEVVPYLPDYSAACSKLKALLLFLEGAYSGQVDRLVQGWLQRTPPLSVPFRRWVLRDWLKCSHLLEADDVALQRWKHALLVAATNETVRPLKQTLLKCLGEVDETLTRRGESGNELLTRSLEVSQSILTVDELLDFCWMHAEELATCSLLCAAKLHALAIQTQRSAMKLAEDDGVLVRVRWSLMLKPMLFKPLLQHTVALKTLSGKITMSPLWSSDELCDLVELIDLASRESILAEMTATRVELKRAFASGAQHLHGMTVKTKERPIAEAGAMKYAGGLSTKEKKQLVAELGRDLAKAPSHLFPHVFMFFSCVLRTATSEDSDLLVEALRILFALFNHRSHDPNSALDILGLLLRGSLAAKPVWLANSALYLDTTELLSEAATMQTEPTAKWAAKMALQQLLFECDVRLLAVHQSTLSRLLPQHLERLISLRLGR
ncbi:unnamed protein product [Phytophthora lilii]|uniref:Unnamed protein product n=1 Tax=Phytophthora lilii TaxID=2077276 RepID=A0A9W6TJF0_9STRA|nr:unnamed protein product [Phytophthora lilii]